VSARAGAGLHSLNSHWHFRLLQHLESVRKTQDLLREARLSKGGIQIKKPHKRKVKSLVLHGNRRQLVRNDFWRVSRHFLHGI